MKNLLLFFVTTFFAATSSPSTVEIVHLSDQNFEHDTQAASGQTTGRWLVGFAGPSHAEFRIVLERFMLGQNEQEENQVIVADVDIEISTKLKRRFDDVFEKSYPTLALFEQQKMRVLKGSDVKTVEDVKSFVFQKSLFREVPKESSKFDELRRTLALNIIKLRSKKEKAYKIVKKDWKRVSKAREEGGLKAAMSEISRAFEREAGLYGVALIVYATFLFGFLMTISVAALLNNQTTRGSSAVKKNQ